MSRSRLKVILREHYKTLMVLFGKPTLEFWDRNCLVCQKQQWQYCIDHKDATGIDILSDWGMVEGYGLLCPECFENFINDAQIKNIEVFWENGSTTSEECGDVFAKSKPKPKE
jgi:hypothetical protein